MSDEEANEINVSTKKRIEDEARIAYFEGDKDGAVLILRQNNFTDARIKRLFKFWDANKELYEKEKEEEEKEADYDEEYYEKLKESKGRRRKGMDVGDKLPWQKDKFAKKMKRPRIPLFGSIGVDQKRDVVWGLILIIIGMVATAIMGSMWLFFAFLSLAGYILLPSPEEVIGRGMEKVRRKYSRAIAKAETKEEREKIEAIMKEDLENQRTLKRIQAREGFMKWGSAGIKSLFKMGFFVFFSLAFVTSMIPMFKPLGIMIAFLGYFMEG